MEIIMAQGTFDLLHPGHIHYLERSAELGDRLVVVVARDSRVEYRKNLIFDEKERVKILDALECVDEARLGSESDIYSAVEEIDPDVITLGYDQGHDEEEVQKMAEKATGNKVEINRMSRFDDYSSSKLKFEKN